MTWIDPWGLSKSNLIDGRPKNPGIVHRFISSKEFKNFKKNGFTFDPKDPRGGISATSIHLQARNPDYIRNATGALRADYYIDIDTRNLDVTYKGKTKGRLPDWKIRSSLDFDSKAIVGHGKVSKC
ncbi:hypothetical protein ACQP6C_10210 [Snodgrassella alvi]|uniref:hypothetical protein n=1 Tax=Snodgrassella alvi TaxID=1196083 RepID=UPI003D0016FA